MISEGDVEWRSADLIGDTIKNHRLPLKVHQALWNPNIDLLALASQNGDIYVRRLHLKPGWKKNVLDIKSILVDDNQPNGDNRLQAICWNPDGKVLAAALRNGLIHLLDTEKGLVRFTVRLCCTTRSIRWQKLSADNVADNVLENLEASVVQVNNLPTVNKDQSTEKICETNQSTKLKEFCDSIAPMSLLGTLLFVIDEENAITLLAAGILPIAKIEPPAEHFVNCDPYSIAIGDLMYSKQEQLLFAVYTCMGQASPPACTYGYNTQVISYNIDSLDYFKDGFIWKIVHRWLQIFYALSYLSETFKEMSSDWKELSWLFNDTFALLDSEKTDVNLADVFSNLMLNGYATPGCARFLRDGLKSAEWKENCEWVTKGYGRLIKIVGGPLSSDVQLLTYHIRQFINELTCGAHQRQIFRLLPLRIYDIDIYPYGEFAEEKEENICSELDDLKVASNLVAFKLAELEVVAISNRRELSHFIRWINSVQPPSSMNKNKSSVPEVKTFLQFDENEVFKFIMKTFGPPKHWGDHRGTHEEFQEEKNETEMSPEICVNDKNSSTIEIDQEESKTRIINFDRVKQFFGENVTDSLIYHADLKHNGWSCPEFEPFISGESSSKTLAQSIKECIKIFSCVQEHLQKRFSNTVKVIKCVHLQSYQSEAFDKFSFFPLSKDLHSCDLGVSCISGNGHKHCIYSVFGNLISYVNYAFEQKNDNSPINATVINETEENEMVESLKVDVTSPTRLTFLLTSPSCIMDRRLVQFYWYGKNVYYGLIRVKKREREFTRLIKGSLYDKIIEIHEDSSQMEPLSFIEISAKHKLGLTLSECRSRVKLFKIDERMTLHQDEIMPEVQDSEGNLGTCSDVRPEILALLNIDEDSVDNKMEPDIFTAPLAVETSSKKIARKRKPT